MNPFLSSEKKSNKEFQIINAESSLKKEIKNNQCSSHSKAFARFKRHSSIMLKEMEKEKKVKGSEKIKNMVALLEKQIESNKESSELNEKRNTFILSSNDILMMRNTFGKNNKIKKKEKENE